MYELDSDGRQLACRQLTDYTGDKVRTLYPNASELRTDWLDPERRAEIVERLEEKGIDLDSWLMQSESRRPTRSISFAISPITRRCALGASALTVW